MSKADDSIHSNIITSGEVLYQLNGINQIGKQLYHDISNEFWDFMSSNHHEDGIETNNNSIIGSSSSHKSIINSESILQTKKMINHSIESYVLKLRHRILEIRKAIDIMKQSTINTVQLANEEYKAKLQFQFKQFESNTMQLVLQYYQIIKDELDSSRLQLVQENIEKQLLCKQAEMIRDIRLFACHLIIESKGKISFTMLQRESQQFTRCVKAVMDNISVDKININMAHKEHFKKGTKVLNVFKLQNACLSNRLQNASETITNGKIKGLFCCLPKEYFYSFSVFGLYAQSLTPPTNNNNSSNHLQEILRDHLTDAWFHTSIPPTTTGSGGMKISLELENTLKSTGSAARLASQKGSKNNGVLRFSRYSTISNLESFSHEEIDNGLFLVLCRVLVVNQLTIDTIVTDADISLALKEGRDCIYSTISDEYVLLQPNYVLPEFFMHVHFPIGSNSIATKSRNNQQSLPRNLDQHGTLNTLLLSPEIKEIKSLADSNKLSSIKLHQHQFYPLENLLLSNAMYPIEKNQSDQYCNKRHLFNDDNKNQNEDTLIDDDDTNMISQYFTDSLIINPSESLFKKQAIVESLHISVQKFNAVNQILLKEYITNLSKNTSL